MTFIIRHRGSSDRPIIAEYLCPVHGRFEREVPRDPMPDLIPCECGELSPWTISAPRFKRQYGVAATRGKSDPPPSPLYMDTEPMADGVSYGEWSEGRDKVWGQHRERQIKKMVST